MAEAENSDKNTPQSPHRRHQQTHRPPYSGKGRGRLDPHVSKALHVFGVSDLRELLDRKQQDPRQSTNGPPPDPSYSYLKDPLRENTDCDDPSRAFYKEGPQRVQSGSRARGHSTRGSRERGGYVTRDDKNDQFEASLILNPINIKIALTTSTGERSCKLDEENKLVDIKNVSSHRPQERRSFRGEHGSGRGSSGRGRGRYKGGKEADGHTIRDPRGRGRYEGGKETEGGHINRDSRGRGRYEGGKETEGGHLNRDPRGKGRYEGGKETEHGHTNRDPRGRGRYEGGKDMEDDYTNRDPRGRGRYKGGKETEDGHTNRDLRGRGGRRMGRGRERGRTSNRNNQKQNAGSNSNQAVNTAELAAEDNWDIECSNSALELNESLDKKGEENSPGLEEVCVQNSEEHEPEQYYREDDVCPESIETNLLQRGTEENLIITSSVSEESEDVGKRTVTFKLVDAEVDADRLEQTAGLKDISSEQKINTEEPDLEINKQKDDKTVESAIVSKHEVEEEGRETNEKETKVDKEVKPAEISEVDIENGNTNT